MIKKIFPFIILLFSTYITISAQEISLNEAETLARNFFYERIQTHQKTDYQNIIIRDSHCHTLNQIPIYYAINFKPKGFVIVSACFNVKPVLAYSFEGSYSTDNQHPAFLQWMKQYEEQIIFVFNHASDPILEIEQEWEYYLHSSPDQLKASHFREVSPLLISKWDQGIYYNQMCPYDPGGPGDRCVTGCVATAMGQLCYYFRWPESGVGSYAYEHPDYGTLYANFEETSYQFTGMSNELLSPSPHAATLLYHLGVAVDMVYGPDGSGMYNHKAAYALRTHFKYSPETIYLYRDSTNLDWDSTIVAHLNQKIPMYYAGWSVPNINGHAFIVDGYQTEEYFHFNWGWGGLYDAYFYLDNLSPGGSNFNLAQELIIHCYPDSINYTYPFYCGSVDTVTSYTGTIDDGSGPLYNYQNNQQCKWLLSPQGTHDTVTNLTLNFELLDTENDMDMIRIYDGPDEDSPLLGTFSGVEIPASLTSAGNQVLIVFETNSTNTASGWLLNYDSHIPLWCDGMTTLTGDEGNFDDGSGTFYYQHELNCMWLIESTDAQSITLFFDAFETQEQFDRVEIYNGVTYQLVETFSGIYNQGSLPPPVTIDAHTIWILFKTDLDTAYAGWEAHWVSDWVGIENNSMQIAEEPLLYPNPAKDLLNILYPPEEVQTIILYNLAGNVIDKFEIIDHQESKTLNLGKFSSGIYFIDIRTEKQVFRKKILKI